MNEIFRWINIARPFLEEAYAVALLIDPASAVELRVIIDAIARLANVPVDPNAPPSSARGLTAILAYGQSVIQALNNLKELNATSGEKTKQANQLVANLSDPTKVYQAIHGQDAAALASFKLQATELAVHIND